MFDFLKRWWAAVIGVLASPRVAPSLPPYSPPSGAALKAQAEELGARGPALLAEAQAIGSAGAALSAAVPSIQAEGAARLAASEVALAAALATAPKPRG